MIQDIPTTITRSFRRTLSIQVHPEKGLVIRAPRFMSDFRIQKFLEEKEDWILKHVSKQKERKTRVAKAKQHKFEPGETFQLLGEETLPPFHEKAKIIAWYKIQALKIFTERTEFYAAKLSEIMNTRISPTSIKIRSYKSRYGCCTPKNQITYNWNVVMAPQPIVDYLVIHELCHIIHKNHSSRFYDLVEKLDPAYKTHRKWLRNNGPTLTL